MAVQAEDSSAGTFTTNRTSNESSPLITSKPLDMSVNKFFLVVFISTFNLPGLVLGYAMAYANPLTECMNLKFGWVTDSE